MGMYRWTVYFLKEWGVSCEHVHGFNMDEWSDAKGNTLPSDDPGAFQNAMESRLLRPPRLGHRTRPLNASSPRPIACPSTLVESPI